MATDQGGKNKKKKKNSGGTDDGARNRIDDGGRQEQRDHLSVQAYVEELVLGVRNGNASDQTDATGEGFGGWGKGGRRDGRMESDRGEERRAGAGTRKRNKAKQTARSRSAACLCFFLC